MGLFSKAKTVETVLKGFSKTLDDLREVVANCTENLSQNRLKRVEEDKMHEENVNREVVRHTIAVTALDNERMVTENEMVRAQHVMEQLDNLINIRPSSGGDNT